MTANGPSSAAQFLARLSMLCGFGAVILLGWVQQSSILVSINHVETGAIEGGSMAETLLGLHFRIPCDDCRFPFSCNAQPDLAPSESAICPNCGFRNRLAARHGRTMDTVSINTASQPPRRGQIIAFRPWPAMSEARGLDDRRDWIVKRVVGLPGEHLAICRGDLYINGKILRKSLVEQERMRILVHDDGFRPSLAPNLPRRWSTSQPSSGWRQTKSGYRFEPNLNRVGLSGNGDWLNYRHWPCMPMQPRYSRTEEDFIKDNYGHNQIRQGEMFVVHDLMLMCRVRLSGFGVFSLLADDGKAAYQVDLSTHENSVTLWKNGRVIEQARLGVSLRDRDRQVVLSLFDRQLLLAIDGRLVIRHIGGGMNAERVQTLRPLGIAAADVSATVGQLRVYRDIYYLDPQRIGRNWEFERRLKTDEYFVLGDNVPISEDSRTWGAVSSDMIAGSVIMTQ